MTTKQATARRKPQGYQQLLSIESDAKTVKGSARGYLTGILYLAPATTSGVMNTCPMASLGCMDSCLFTAGRAGTFPKINEARIRKTRFYASNPEAFIASLRYDIESLIISAQKRGLIPAVRINGTSDLPKLALEMAAEFPDVQFYDYTKLPKAWQRTRPNYHLTFSHAETNESECMRELAHGINVAVVFGIRKGQPLPETWNGYRVISGDETDLRFTDPREVVIGLYAKGRAKRDCSGFVVRTAAPALIQIGATA